MATQKVCDRCGTVKKVDDNELIEFFYKLHCVNAFIRVTDFKIAKSEGAAGSTKGELSVDLRIIVLSKQS